MRATTPAPSGAPPLSFYTRAPTKAIELDAFERVGLLRLKVLCALSASPRGRSDRELHHQVEALDAFQELFTSDNGAADSTSHYALRLAFCKSRDLIEWLVAMEAKLFALRLRSCSPQEVIELLAHEGIPYETVPSSSFSTSTERQWAASPSNSSSSSTVKTESVVFKVPFQEVSYLVKHRRVLVKKGICFVPAHCMGYVAQHHFRVSLEQQLKILQCALPANPETRSFADRLEPILERFIAQSRLQSSDSFLQRGRGGQPQITAETIDSMAEKHFPLCMRHLHRKLRENHHLKYDGRVQYRMFLKGIGWPVHDTLLFFRNEFVRVIPPARFDKEYAYHIRHSYGLEGARKDYAPLDCEQIILHGSVPRLGQYHGCPFRHWDAAHLSAELRAQSGVSAPKALDISTQAASGNFQGACQRFFDASHLVSYTEAAAQTRVGTSSSGQQQRIREPVRTTVSHPNEWLEASLQSS